MIDDATLTKLALLAREGDQAAATMVVRQTRQQLWRMLGVLTDRRVAEDLMQETYARAFRSLPGFRAESSVRAWLLAIGRRVAADHLRSSRAGPTIDPGTQPEQTSAARERGDLSESVALHAMLDNLEPDRREAFTLTQMLGLSYQEAAEVCGCPVGTIRSRVARARDDLVTQLTDQRHPKPQRRRKNS